MQNNHQTYGHQLVNNTMKDLHLTVVMGQVSFVKFFYKIIKRKNLIVV